MSIRLSALAVALTPEGVDAVAEQPL